MSLNADPVIFDKSNNDVDFTLPILICFTYGFVNFLVIYSFAFSNFYNRLGNLPLVLYTAFLSLAIYLYIYY